MREAGGLSITVVWRMWQSVCYSRETERQAIIIVVPVRGVCMGYLIKTEEWGLSRKKALKSLQPQL